MPVADASSSAPGGGERVQANDVFTEFRSALEEQSGATTAASGSAAGERQGVVGRPVRKAQWSGKGWQITITDTEVTIAQASGTISLTSVEASRLEVRRHWLRWAIRDNGQPFVPLRGITKSKALGIAAALRSLVLMPAIADAVAWHASITHLLARALTEQRWIPTESVDALVARRPEPSLLDRIRSGGGEESFTSGQIEAVKFVDTDVAMLVSTINEQIVAAEFSSRRAFFETIEKSPLTAEQARAVVCFDNRVQVLAAARQPRPRRCLVALLNHRSSG
jgi:DNA helicase-4